MKYKLSSISFCGIMLITNESLSFIEKNTKNVKYIFLLKAQYVSFTARGRGVVVSRNYVHEWANVLTFYKRYCGMKQSGAESRGSGMKPVEWIPMRDTCETHQSRVPWSRSGAFIMLICCSRLLPLFSLFMFILWLKLCLPVPVSFFPELKLCYS